ncbi:MAG: phosphate regulon sensor histidine kinase PhoR [Rhodocyclaceae bacterium]|nr:phosphate regulon sensor histidine kinase PhoR [Rhodocyclaceae bacterium]MDZ4214385.1 phosphate regulon sensor histidine kinase PhoR [Rhodocyclaceae bacterium]
MPIRLLIAGVFLSGCGALVNRLFGGYTAVAAVTLLAILLLARHERQIARLTAWAEKPLGTPVPEASGIWSPPFLALHRRARQAATQREELIEMGERFRLAAEALPDGVIILDEHRTIEWMNPRAERLLGLDSSRDIGMMIGHLMREPEFIEFLDQTPEKQQIPLVVRPMRNPGHVLHIRGTPFSAGRTLLLIEDLTQLDRLETVRRDFVANVSHELRTPLTVVQGFLETAKDGMTDEEHPTPSEEIVQYLDMALDHSRRMHRLVEDLLTLSSLETDAPPQEEVIEVAPLLALVREEIVALSAGRHEIRLDNTGPAKLLGSSRELHSAFSNLASNAVRYTPEGGKITLAWQGDRQGAVFTVTDTGIGIEARHLHRLTERFYRVDRGRSRESGGTGLGLAIVKHVLERHEATLMVDSTPGKGSRFAASFPGRNILTKN